jgi:hypothetical protein
MQVFSRLRPLNAGLILDVRLLGDWDDEHPGVPVYMYQLYIDAGVKASGEVAKLSRWGLARWTGEHYDKDNNVKARYQISQYGNRFRHGEIPVHYESWDCDGTLNHASPLFYIHQVTEGFDLRTLRREARLSRRQFLQREGGPPPPEEPPPGCACTLPPPIPLPPLPSTNGHAPDPVVEYEERKRKFGIK